jgi:hypothetical protein
MAETLVRVNEGNGTLSAPMRVCGWRDPKGKEVAVEKSDGTSLRIVKKEQIVTNED